ncbi:sunset domain-containing protein [Gemelliphila palaticanis]|uniref:sunset domain-containing protein n=1 Tax=Gemelliphila palaticanis TaxID=81950 RepID=UPI003F694DF8
MSSNTSSNTSQVLIKGNVNSKIYHMPYQKHYNKISPANTVYFNSEEEAQAAGYRRAKQ